MFGNLLASVDRKVSTRNVLPKHGPGSTADGLIGNDKFRQTEWTWRLEEGGATSVDFLLPNSRYYEYLDHVQFLEPGEERPVEVTPVPKTMKTPRLIAIEPTAMQYVQQAVLEAIEDSIEKDNLSKMLISWKDQTPNQRMALQGSRDGSLATLDLSEASDRVSNSLVLALCKNFPSLSSIVQASRSTHANVLNHGIIPLVKFASMGSALCFPFESMVFMTLILIGIEKCLGHQLTYKDILSLLGKVRTYGDDIIVPSEYAVSVAETLTDYGFKVNAGKSFWTGKFRESCGKWYFDGIDVTPVYLRQLPPSTRRDVPEVVSFVSLRNQLYERGLWQTVKQLDTCIERIIPFPAVLSTSPGIGKMSYLGYQTQRTHPDLQVPLVKAAVLRMSYRDIGLDEHHALLKWFLKRGLEPFADRKHLERSGRPVSVDIMTRWTPSF